jgi:hypothetical protein
MLNRPKKRDNFAEAGRLLIFACGRIIQNSVCEIVLQECCQANVVARINGPPPPQYPIHNETD